MSSDTYDKIETVISEFGRPMAAHEFNDFDFTLKPTRMIVNARRFVNQSEATIARRMREMRVLGRLASKRRTGKNFVEFELIPRQLEVAL